MCSGLGGVCGIVLPVPFLEVLLESPTTDFAGYLRSGGEKESPGFVAHTLPCECIMLRFLACLDNMTCFATKLAALLLLLPGLLWRNRHCIPIPVCVLSDGSHLQTRFESLDSLHKLLNRFSGQIRWFRRRSLLCLLRCACGAWQYRNRRQSSRSYCQLHDIAARR